MIKFYRNAFLALLWLVVLTMLVLYTGYHKSKLISEIYPTANSSIKWVPVVEPPAPVGLTSLREKSAVGIIDYEFFLDPNQSFPYTHYSFNFVDFDNPFSLVDLTAYNKISFTVFCEPKNVLLLTLFSFDDKITDFQNPVTRRVSSAAFSCDNHWNTIDIPLNDIYTPHWWLSKFGFEFSEKDYALDKTMAIAFINSLQSPVNTPSHVRISDVTLIGKQPLYFYIAIAMSIFAWLAVLVMLIRHYIRVLTVDLMEKVRHDQPLLAYRKLTIEPQKDKDKSALLRYMATEYADAGLSLEIATSVLGINRTKINEILKEELGLTFTTYINKLRLTEAARLLSEKSVSTVAEIAYSVGYNNVSYFNKLFKSQYGCTPKTFKSLDLDNNDSR